VTVRIAVDIQAIQSWSSKGRGIGRYIVDFVDALIKREDVDLVLLTNPKRPMTSEVLDFTSRVTVKSIADTDWVQGLDWYLISSPFEMDLSMDDLWPPHVRGRVRTAAIAYDLIPLRYSDQYLAYAPYEISYKTRLELLSSIDLLMAISEATANDLREHFGDQPKVTTIGTGVPSAFDREEGVTIDPYVEIPELKPGFIMYTGGGDPRKNVAKLISAYGTLPANVRSKHQLVLVYRLTEYERTLLSEQCEQLEIVDDVLVTGYLPDETLRALYGTTHLFVFPSLYEGFGLPIVEASLNNAPVIASDSSSMVELIRDEKLRFDPTQESAIAIAIREALERDDLETIASSQRSFISEKFTWQNVASEAVKSMHDSGVQRTGLPSHDAADRPRIALVGPLPPQHSGVADYMWRLLPHIAQDVDVVCVVEVEARAGVPLPPDGVSVVTVPEFEAMRRVESFEEIVIVMGNSTFHHYCWDLLNELSGVVLAHELRYTGLFQSYASLRGLGPAYFRDLLWQEYAGLDPNLDLNQFLESDTAADLGIHLVGPVIDRARRFLTTSDSSARVARLIRPTRSNDIASVGFAYPISPSSGPIDRPVAPILASIGIQWHTKRTMDLVRSLAIVRETIPGASLRLVGPIDKSYAADVGALARKLGVRSAVSILGRVPRDELEREIESASVALQLRATSNGEVSAAIADCMVAGTPVITTSIGAQTELADAGVELLSPAATPADIAAMAISILQDESRQKDMSASGRNWAIEHDPANAARELLSALELRPVN
jgi:glycosyltransferase involved in cell wall biosynthesis